MTVGVQLPFDRLVRTVDEWIGRNPGVEAIAQTGRAGYVPRHFPVRETIAAPEYRRIVEDAELVVAHAGMGSILTALELGKRILVMPRRADLGEHRNDHQRATARYMADQGLVTVAQDEADLTRLLDGRDSLAARERISSEASPQLMALIREFIEQVPRR